MLRQELSAGVARAGSSVAARPFWKDFGTAALSWISKQYKIWITGLYSTEDVIIEDGDCFAGYLLRKLLGVLYGLALFAVCASFFLLRQHPTVGSRITSTLLVVYLLSHLKWILPSLRGRLLNIWPLCDLAVGYVANHVRSHHLPVPCIVMNTMMFLAFIFSSSSSLLNLLAAICVSCHSAYIIGAGEGLNVWRTHLVFFLELNCFCVGLAKCWYSLLEEHARLLTQARKQTFGDTIHSGTFLATLMHDLKNPISVIVGCVDGLKKAAGLKYPERKGLRMVSHSCEVLFYLIGLITDLSKLEVGKMDIDHIPMNVIKEARKILLMEKELALQKGLQLYQRCLTPIPQMVFGDPVRFSRILMNLLGNAIKFTSHGYVAILLRWEQAECDDDSNHDDLKIPFNPLLRDELIPPEEAFSPNDKQRDRPRVRRSTFSTQKQVQAQPQTQTQTQTQIPTQPQPQPPPHPQTVARTEEKKGSFDSRESQREIEDDCNEELPENLGARIEKYVQPSFFTASKQQSHRPLGQSLQRLSCPTPEPMSNCLRFPSLGPKSELTRAPIQRASSQTPKDQIEHPNTVLVSSYGSDAESNFLESEEDDEDMLKSIDVPGWQARNKGLLIIEVIDTGVGMKEEELQSLFQPYKQGNATIKGRFGGTGLGLWITQQLLQLLSGKITVKSQFKKGTRFQIEIPFQVYHTEDASPPASEDASMRANLNVKMNVHKAGQTVESYPACVKTETLASTGHLLRELRRKGEQKLTGRLTQFQRLRVLILEDGKSHSEGKLRQALQQLQKMTLTVLYAHFEDANRVLQQCDFNVSIILVVASVNVQLTKNVISSTHRTLQASQHNPISVPVVIITGTTRSHLWLGLAIQNEYADFTYAKQLAYPLEECALQHVLITLKTQLKYCWKSSE